ncbi:hypothetical protein SK128_007967 [Halocaridina rubra]|uniref:Uncharacterized protein n=1 Tax=Halocaridina rubra TaxID=373956 RepID=A0AAN8WTC2_HALRR
MSQSQHRGGAGTSNQFTSQPVMPGDLILARDIRFVLHTILTIMRELPDQLKELSNEIGRNSQQPEETNKLIKDTSEQLQGLVVGLENKLTLLLDNKENSDDVLQHILSEPEIRTMCMM